MRRALLALPVLLIISAPSSLAQQSPFLSDSIYQALINEVSGEIAYEHIRWFTHFHRPMGGSEGFEKVAAYVEEKAKEYGLENVRYIRLSSDTASWTAKLGELILTEPYRRRLAFTPEIAISLADYSRSTDVSSAELIDVGDGTSESDYKGKTVTGKVVLASGPLSSVMAEAVWKRGALGVIAFTNARAADHPDQIPWMRIPVEDEKKEKKGTFAFVLSNREGMRLRRELSKTKRPYLVSVKIESSFLATPTQAIVEGVIRGSEIHDQDIVLTAHLQEELFSANDDASGCASILEIARALNRLIASGAIPRPRRDIRFWWVDEISAEEQYFSDFPAERAQFLASVNQDMVGALQSAGSRVQFVTRLPWSRAHFLEQVTESIVESLVHGNTAYLAAGQARQLQRGEAGTSAITNEGVPFSRPVLSHLGTRERYDARLIPFHNNTDHQVFNMGIIGIPAITFTNWPDDYIHSTADDLWQMDRTQLRRNAIAVAAIALYVSSVGSEGVPALAAHLRAGGMRRIAGDEERATELALSGESTRAQNLLRESVMRERRALESLLAVAGGSVDEVRRVIATLPNEAAIIAAFEAAIPPSRSPVTAAVPAASLSGVPSRVSSVRDFLAGRKELKKPPSLHALMAYEVLNFVDGVRTVAEIHRAVSAEADAAGEWYYGRVSIDDVKDYLDSAEKAKMISFDR